MGDKRLGGHRAEAGAMGDALVGWIKFVARVCSTIWLSTEKVSFLIVSCHFVFPAGINFMLGYGLQPRAHSQWT